MTFLYIDESGDLGFKKTGSEYFVITCVKIDDEKTNLAFRRIPQKVRLRKLSKKYKETPELKFSNSSEIIRNGFLTRAAMLNIEVYSLIIKKEHTKKDLQENLPILYNYLINVLLEKPLAKVDRNFELTVCLDKCMSPSQRNNFEAYTKTKFLGRFMTIPKISISHENSRSNGGLQALDFICGAFGYKYNTAKLKGDCGKYTSLIKNRIILEKTDLFKNDRLATNPA